MRYLITLLSLLITALATAQTGTQIHYLQWDGTQFQDRLLTPANNTLVGFTNTGVLGSVALSGLSLSGDTLSLGNHSAALLTSGTLDIARLTDASITNAKLANSGITINGTSVPLGGSVSGLQTTAGTLALAGFGSITGTLPAGNIATHSHAQSDITGLTTTLAAKAALASPAFTGTPTAPTASASTNTTQIATTAHVKTAASRFLGTATNLPIVPLTSFTGKIGDCALDTYGQLNFIVENNGSAPTDWLPLPDVSTLGDALTSGTLAQFAATTSDQLRGVLSDESGTGNILTTNGSAASLTSFPTLNQNTTGSAASFTGTLAGDVTGTQGATVISAATVTGKAITGFVSGSGTVTATDTILTAINKLNGNDALKAPIASPTFTGNVTGTFIGNVTGNVTGSSGSTTGNAATATALQTARTINGTAFDGTGNITVTASADTLTGTTIPNSVTGSGLQSVGTLTSLSTSGTITTTLSGLGTTPSSGLWLYNSTAAAAGAQQISPGIRLEGNGRSTAPAASRSVATELYTLPVQGTSAPTLTFKMDSIINGTRTNLAIMDADGFSSLGSGSFSMKNVSGTFTIGGGTIAVGGSYFAGNTIYPGLYTQTACFQAGGSAGICDVRGYFSPTDAQLLRIHNTYTSATNYERSLVGWVSNVFKVGPEKGSGGGTARAMELQTDGTTRVTLDTTGNLLIKNAGTIPGSNPTGGGYLYSEGGALKWRGSSGTITTIAPP